MRSPKRSSLRNMPPPRSTGKNAPRFNRRLKNNDDKIDKRDIDTSVKLKKENTKQRIVKLTEKDPSDLGFEKVTKLLKETNKTKFSDLMRMRLNGRTKKYMEI